MYINIVYNFFILLLAAARMVGEDNDNKESQIVEHGDIFFFYRPKVGIEEVEDIGDVQRFYMVTSPENGDGSGGKTKKTAASRLASAAAIAKVLAGIEFPKDKNEIVNYAEIGSQIESITIWQTLRNQLAV